MRDQYAGDISDLLKYALLRELVGDDRRLGVAWYYVPGHDGRRDGRHTEHCSEAEWRRLDAPLHAALAGLHERSVAALERLPIWPADTVFHGEPVPAIPIRAHWTTGMARSLEACDLVFVDPDNGVRERAGRSDGRKHATMDEVRILRRPGRALLLIKFPERTKHGPQLAEYHESLRIRTGAEDVLTIRTTVLVLSASGKHRLPRQRWFTLLDGGEVMRRRAGEFAQRLSEVPFVRAAISDGLAVARCGRDSSQEDSTAWAGPA